MAESLLPTVLPRRQGARPFRCALFVPGNQERMLEKAAHLEVDALFIDLEDSVSLAEKESARDLVAKHIPALRCRTVFVRVNDLTTALTADDIEAVVQPVLAGIFMPKVDSGDDIKIVDYLLYAAEKHKGLPIGQLSIAATIETAAGVANCREILTASSRVDTVMLSVTEDGDLHRELGAVWTPEGLGLQYARGRVLVEARAAGIPNIIDGPFARYPDDAGLLREATLARQLGYTGKAAIHPRQVLTISEAFSPSEEEIAYYRRVIAAMDEAAARGSGAVAVEGRMIDAAMVARARQVLRMLDKA